MSDFVSSSATVQANGPSAEARPVAFLLHALGGSTRAWTKVIERLEAMIDCEAIDLPGFGDNAGIASHTVQEMADHVAAVIRKSAPRRWILVGHSMGAKIAAIVARRAEDGEPGLAGLSHLVLLAGSPPKPEPMDEERRAKMQSWFAGDAASSRQEAHDFVTQNVAVALAASHHERAVADVLRADRAAWLAWLDRGSCEDWSAFVGVLKTPTLIVAGSEDGDLGADAQRDLNAPHYATPRLLVIDGAAHLLPIEKPDDVARLIAEHVSGGPEPSIPSNYRTLLESARVSARTRSVLLNRLQPVGPAHSPEALIGAGELPTLRAVLDRVVPQEASPPIDLAARIDKMLAAGQGDGWRFAGLPSDVEAYRAGLATFDAAAQAEFRKPFADLSPEQQDGLLTQAADGRLRGHDAHPGLSAAQMRQWFEDVRSDAVRTYVSHPATLARIGYGGIANGGDGARKQGFELLGADERATWEPEAAVGTRS